MLFRSKKVVGIASHNSHRLALQFDGTVAAWGTYLTSTGTMAQLTVPFGLKDVADITTGDSHVVAVLTNGSLFTWGENYAGQTNYFGRFTNAVKVASGDMHNVAVLGTVPKLGSL